ncbi:MAG TPA: HAD-IC family P-type ATPase, partial [Gammaproteobacteria bacterium]|nr:HAD-IC family P-type ATPase [Gammaproteobacteria bacterium]
MATKLSFWNKSLIFQALQDALTKLSPRLQFHNPIMFTVYIAAVFTTGLSIRAFILDDHFAFHLWITVWLWFTVLFANFAEAMAEGRGRAQATSLRKSRQETHAKKIDNSSKRDAKITIVSSASLRKGDTVLVEAHDFIPSDGEVIEGIAFVNESAITGESAPVIRESGGDRSSVTGGTQVISDWIVVRISADPGDTFLDHMIALVEGAKRKKTPNELALTILLTALTLIFLIVCVTLLPFSIYSVNAQGSGHVVTLTVLAALFVCLAPTTIGALLSAIGIAGMDRMIQANVIATSGRAIEAAGDVDILLLDKTGTITLGNRQATE